LDKIWEQKKKNDRSYEDDIGRLGKNSDPDQGTGDTTSREGLSVSRLLAYFRISTSAPFVVSRPRRFAAGSTTISDVDQNEGGGQWNLLGTHDFDGSASVRVVSGSTGRRVSRSA